MPTQTKTLELNQFQLNNIDFLGPEDLDELRAGNPSRSSASLMLCVNCGRGVTYPIMRFFRFDPTRFLCYKCQNK